MSMRHVSPPTNSRTGRAALIAFLGVVALLGAPAPTQASLSFTRPLVHDGGVKLTSILLGNMGSGDLDGDGRPDVITLAPGTVEVFLNQGRRRFAPAAHYPVHGDPGGVVVTDLNGDGRLDVACTDVSRTGAVDVLLGGGDGTLAAARSFSVPASQLYGLTAADFDGDGKLDLAALDVGGGFWILDGDGTGGFGPARAFPSAGMEAGHIAAGDLDGDGYPDLVTSGFFPSSGLVVQRNDTHGGFDAPVLYETGAGVSPWNNAVLAHLDAGPSLDVALATDDGIDVFLNDGSGHLTQRSHVTMMPRFGLTAGGIALADLTGDGRLDVVIAHGNEVRVAEGHGDGTFAPITDWRANGEALGVPLAIDVDGDGRVDLATANMAMGIDGFSLMANDSGLPGGCTVTGTSGDDDIVGTPGDDVICALSGNDTVKGLGGDDLIRGGPGDDGIDGGNGDDFIQAGDGNDRLNGGPGADILSGGLGTDTVAYTARITPVQASIGDGANDGAPGEGDDIHIDVENLDGGHAGDTLVGSYLRNILYGRDGDDTLVGNGRYDVLVAGAGNDTLRSAGDGVADRDVCRPGFGTAIADPFDAVIGCASTVVP